MPSQLLQNRPDIRQAERELAAAGLDVKVARVNFFPQLVITGGVGLESLLLNHLFEPNAVVGDIAGGLVGPLVNKRAIRAQYLTANARQLQAIYNYQRVILDAFTQVINRMTKVENYSKSIEIKKQQLKTLEAAVEFADDLFQNARIEYIDVLFAQRDLRDARVVLIDTKTEQLAAIVNTYQALGGGVLTISTPADFHGQFPYIHTVRSGENFWTISLLYYRSSRYGKALWAANKDAVPDFDRLTVGDKIIIPPVDQLDPALIEEVPAPAPPVPETVPVAEPATLPRSRPRHHPQACLARSARRGPKTPPSKPPAAPNPPRPRRSRRRRGSDRLARAEQEGLALGGANDGRRPSRSIAHAGSTPAGVARRGSGSRPGDHLGPVPTSPREVRRDLSALRVPRIGLVRPEDEVEEHAHLAVRLDRMPQRAVQVHLVAIPPPLAQAREVTSLLEVGHDPLDGPLGDPHPMCHLSEAHLGLFCDAE